MRTIVKSYRDKEIARIQNEIEALYKCLEGSEIPLSHHLPVNTIIKINGTDYPANELTQIDPIDLKSCIERIKTELKIISNL